MTDNIPGALRERLRAMAFCPSDARDAIRGVAVPDALGRRAMRLCVVRGLRHHDAFAQSPRAQALRAWPEFARALHARDIMSDRVPDMTGDDEEVPYCIWHPDTAAEDTYRALVRRYPRMAYQVARACAVAGYGDLYMELQKGGSVLPDVAVAEEARACGSQDIYTAITSQPVRYRVMDDYSRSILVDPQPSGLNGDTAVRHMLDVKQKFQVPRGDEVRVLAAGDGGADEDFDDDGSEDDFFNMIPEPGFKENIFDITEDMNIDEFTTPDPDDAADLAMAEYLAKPLPTDLPIGNKDILILAAAYTGNIDRYARLRRPCMIDQEAGCVVRGIYHSPFFATWWATQALPARHAAWIAQAIHARMIMSNDLSRLTPDVPHAHLPYLIWYPAVARASTYCEVARRCPSMRPAVLRAAIFAKDRALFDALLDAVQPDPYLLSEARAHDDDDDDGEALRPSYFTRRLLARADTLGLADEIQDICSDRWGVDAWKRFSVKSGGRHGLPESGNWLFGGPGIVGAAQDPGIYNGVWADASIAELFASAPETWRPKNGGVQVDYEEWPQ